MNDNTAGIAPDADTGAAPVEGQVSVEKVTIPMPFVVIATPSLHHSCSLAHRDSMLDIRGVLIEKGVPHAFISVAGKCPPDLARDRECASAADYRGTRCRRVVFRQRAARADVCVRRARR